jgi:predicted secreted Zn-dependent protease
MASAEIPARVQVAEHVEYYRIQGRDLRELAVQMQLRGPAHSATGRRTAGTTHWSITWSHRLGMRDGQCVLESLDVDAVIRVTLPQWDGDRGNRPAVREWRRFLASLERHEATHVRHGREAASAIRDAMVAVPSQATCALLTRALARTARSQLRRYTLLTRRYDTQTDYGAAQGVRFEF